MRYVRKKNTNIIVTKILNFNQKALPDPNAKFTTMDKFVRSYALKGSLIRLGNSTFKFIDGISHKKTKKICIPTVYSEKKGYMSPNDSAPISKKENLVIPIIND